MGYEVPLAPNHSITDSVPGTEGVNLLATAQRLTSRGTFGLGACKTPVRLGDRHLDGKSRMAVLLPKQLKICLF